MQNDNRVIVVGAGPVGAVMTLALVKKGIPVTLHRAACRTRPRTSAPPPCTRRPSRCWSSSGSRRKPSRRKRQRRHVGAAVPFPRPRHRRTVRRVRHQPAERRGAVSVRAAMGAVQAGARRAAAHRGERHRRGAVLHQADRARAARRPCRRDRRQRGRRNRNAARPLRHRHRRRRAARCGGSPASSSRASPGRSASSRSARRFDLAGRPIRTSARATISPIPTSGSTCSRSRATARPASGAACSRCRPTNPTRRP